MESTSMGGVGGEFPGRCAWAKTRRGGKARLGLGGQGRQVRCDAVRSGVVEVWSR